MHRYVSSILVAWGLRDYGIPPTVWGGDPACEHVWTRQAVKVERSSSVHWQHSTGGGGDGTMNRFAKCGISADDAREYGTVETGFCQHCNAWRGAHGLEPTIDLYCRNAVEIFRAVHRVLRPDGTLWLNLGDSYANDGKWGGETGGKQAYLDDNNRKRVGREKRLTGLKPKDLCGIPWRVAFALQADGWWLRQDIIWAKPNPMPESVTDRCTKAHEYLFLLTKSARYFFDAEAIKEDSVTGDMRRLYGSEGAWQLDGRPKEQRHGGKPRISNGRKALRSDTESRHRSSITGGQSLSAEPGNSRNRRSVWIVPTAPFSEAHFATFPPALIEPCILAGCPKGGTVLDPFGGAGTTGLVADRLQRNAILIELNPDYAAMAQRRLERDAPLLSNVAREAAE